MTPGTALATKKNQFSENCGETYDTMQVPDTMSSGNFDIQMDTMKNQSFGTLLGSGRQQIPSARKMRPESAAPFL